MAGASSRRTLKRTTNSIYPWFLEGRGSSLQNPNAAVSDQNGDFQQGLMSRSTTSSSDSGFVTDDSVLTTSAGSSVEGTSISSKSTHSPPESRLLRSNAEDPNKAHERSKRRTLETIPPAPEDIELSVPAQILLKLKKHVPRLLQSFCIVDMRIHTKPVTALSEDLLPNDDSSARGLPDFINGEYFGEVWTIQSKKVGGRQAYRLVVSGDLIDPTSSSLAVIQCFFAILELTPLIDAVRYSQGDVWCLEGPEPDIWYAVYLEDMDAAGQKVLYRPPKQEVKKVSQKDQLDVAEDMIRLIHKDYFVLQPSRDASGVYEIAVVSPSLLDVDVAVIPPPDLSSLSLLLTKGQQFRCEILWGTVRTLYCLPMAGREVDSWLCFLLDKDLPNVCAPRFLSQWLKIGDYEVARSLIGKRLLFTVHKDASGALILRLD